MKDILKDIVSHTQTLGFIEMLKVVTDENSTEIKSIAADRSVVVSAKTHARVPEFTGVFGMPDLNKLAYLLKNPEYSTDARIELKQDTRNNEVVPTHLHFENAAGDFKNDYRFMAQSVIEERLKNITFKGTAWNVTFTPTVDAIRRMKLMAGAHSEETVFQVRTENGALKFYFGDMSTHAGSFTFHHNVTGNLSHTWSWPVSQTISILDLDGDKTVSISDQGALMISVDSGLAVYEYILPAQHK